MTHSIFRRVEIATALAALAFVIPAAGSEVREFNLRTIERLGNELSRRDGLAAQASDIVLDTQPLARSLKLRGWITDLSSKPDRVHLVTETASGPCLAYTVAFPKSGKPQVEDRRGQPLPPDIALRYKARETATSALDGKFYDASYNFEVLDDPDGSGFLVYALAATNKRGEILMGGHYRVTVSSDGAKAERIDLLSQLIRQEADAGQQIAAMASSQLASNVPVETWLYSSHIYRLPVYVATRDGSTWRIANRKIHKFSKTELEALRPATRKKR